ncbi:hypothetical protein CYMTET_28696 [Cymbomonas tetramitiformis]|uniref:EF-hand domain-containing protein n=1 Tax=Cymbomonas tetramitiformis TaxID=36881 RepID=A0AAE0FMB1_9CHLO|nr:hypothetical protein CYMTET_28696 [Cymbomonas tetramitiformis]
MTAAALRWINDGRCRWINGRSCDRWINGRRCAKVDQLRPLQGGDNGRRCAMWINGPALRQAIAKAAELLGLFEKREISQILEMFRTVEKKKISSLWAHGEGKNPTAVAQELIDSAYEFSLQRLFNAFDMDGSGFISMSEFKQISQCLNIKLSDERIAKLFSQADVSGSGMVEFAEFETALHLLQDEIAHEVMVQFGLDTLTLVSLFCISLLWLLTLFVFIFLGIAAFTSGSSFGSVINSAFTVLAGGSMGAKKEGNTGQEDKLDVEKQVQQVIDDLDCNCL